MITESDLNEFCKNEATIILHKLQDQIQNYDKYAVVVTMLGMIIKQEVFQPHTQKLLEDITNELTISLLEARKLKQIRDSN